MYIMPYSRLPCLRHVAARPISAQKGLQRRWARVHDVRFVATQQTTDRIIDRYKDKLHEKAKQKGLKDVNELKEAYSGKIKILRQQAVVPGATGPLNISPQTIAPPSKSPWPTPPAPPTQQADAAVASKNPGIKTLSSFIDVEKTMDLPPREIEAIWRLRHANNKQSLCAAIPTQTFASIAATARRHPIFLLPGLPQSQVDKSSPDAPPQENTLLHFLQWTFPAPDTVTVIFTHLAEYKLRGEFAQPHTTVTHHLELAHPKGLVLCQGHVMPDRGVSVEEGKWLLLCLQKFYNTKPIEEIEAEASQSEVAKELQKKRRQLIEQFNSGDDRFQLAELVDQAERIG